MREVKSEQLQIENIKDHEKKKKNSKDVFETYGIIQRRIKTRKEAKKMQILKKKMNFKRKDIITRR